MKRILLLSYIIIFNSAYASEIDRSINPQTDCIFHDATGIWYRKNSFGDIFPQWENVSIDQLNECLSLFVDLLKDEYPETPFLIEVPHEKSAAIPQIQKAGFSFYHANNEKSEWIFKNNSSIPEPYTSVIGTQVLIRNNDTVLVIEEKTRKGFVHFPGGTADFNELTRTAATRELQEEVNLDVSPDDLKLFAIINSARINRFKANSVNHYFVVDHTKISGELIPNPNEIVRAFYAPLKDIAAQKNIDGLTVIPPIAALAQHLLDQKAQTHHETFLDYRQLIKEDSKRNLDDAMTIEFFAQ